MMSEEREDEKGKQITCLVAALYISLNCLFLLLLLQEIAREIVIDEGICGCLWIHMKTGVHNFAFIILFLYFSFNYFKIRFCNKIVFCVSKLLFSSIYFLCVLCFPLLFELLICRLIFAHSDSTDPRPYTNPDIDPDLVNPV